MSMNSFSTDTLATSRSVDYVQDRVEKNLSAKTDKVLGAFAELLSEYNQVKNAGSDAEVPGIDKEFAQASNNIVAAQTLLLGHYEKMEMLVDNPGETAA